MVIRRVAGAFMDMLHTLREERKKVDRSGQISEHLDGTLGRRTGWTIRKKQFDPKEEEHKRQARRNAEDTGHNFDKDA